MRIKVLLVVCILATSCAPLTLEAEANLVDAQTEKTRAETEQAEVDAAAEQTGELVDIITTLLDELADERRVDQQTIEALIKVIQEQNNPGVSPWAVAAFILLVGVSGAAFWWRERGRRQSESKIVVVMMPGGQQVQLPAGTRWDVVPQDVEVREIVER